MAGRRMPVSCVFITALLAVLVLPELLSAGPVVQKSKRDADSIQEKAAEAASHRQLIRQRRNISWYNQHSDFWGWYKYFTDNGNVEAVQELDRIYLKYLQNKNRAEGRRSYKAYLSHLADIYKSCADSDDPKCVATYTTRPTPEPPKPAPVKTCDPTKDAYCLYAALVQGKSPYLPLVLPAAPATPAPAAAKAPAPLYVRSAASKKDPQSGYYYYSPAVQPFLSKEQKAELLRICSAEDVECLQYHLRAAHGQKPSAGPLPSYAHLGCDPKKDPNCQPQLVQKAPSGVYVKYPNCDPRRDPYCAYAASLSAPRAPNPPAPAGPGSCNPLYEEGCNPLTANRFSSPPEKYNEEQREEAAAIRAAPAPAEQRSDPYAMFRDAFNNANANRAAADPYAMYRQASGQAPARAASNDPYAMFRQASAQANDPYAMYRQASGQAGGQANDPYAMYRQASGQAGGQANDPYAMYRQPSTPAPAPANDPYAMLRKFISQAQSGDPYAPRMEAAPESVNANDPFARFREAATAMNRRGPSSAHQQHYEEPATEQNHPLGPPGKTKEGYDCYIGYDQECYPVKPSEPRSGAHRQTAYPAEAYEPHLNADGSRNGVVEPTNLDCDPEYDRDCRLRRYEPQEAPVAEAEPERHAVAEEEVAERSRGAAGSEQQQEQYEAEPYQSGQEEAYMAFPQHSQGMPSFQDMLRGYGDQFPEQGDHRFYSDDYRKK